MCLCMQDYNGYDLRHPALWTHTKIHRYRQLLTGYRPTVQSLQQIAGKNAKFAQNLPENCAENALKLRAICASCAQIELKNPRKIAQKLRVNVFWLRRKVFHGVV